MPGFSVEIECPKAAQIRRWLFFKRWAGFLVVCWVDAENEDEAVATAVRRLRGDDGVQWMGDIELQVGEVRLSEKPSDVEGWRTGLIFFPAE
jgi:hypothetical protein